MRTNQPLKSRKYIFLKTTLLLLCAFVCASSTYSQINITGKISDEKGEALPGVSVILKGEYGTGTFSDVDGSYQIAVPSKNAVLQFSYLGFQPQTVAIADKTVVNVIMKETLRELDEVVVVGYGVQKKIHLTGSVSQVNSEELIRAPMTNLSNMMTGKLPGLTSVQASGIPGGDQTNLLIRGAATFGNASPLLLVDGVEVMLNTVNPNDVESVTILKDAAASAVYGFKGANGVILVTTKRGKEGKTKISYDGSATFSFNTRFPKFLNGPDYIYWFDKGREMDGLPRRYDADTQSKVQAGYDPDGVYGNTDWFDLLFKDYGFTQKHNVSVSGGNESTKYFTSLSLMDQDGIVNNVNYKIYNVRSNLDTKITNNLIFTLNLAGLYEQRDWPGISLGAQSYGNPIGQAMFAGPIINTTYNGLPMAWISSGGETQNPIAAIDKSGFQRKDRKQFEGNTMLAYSVPQIKGLKLSMFAAYTAGYTLDDGFLDSYKTSAYNPGTHQITEMVASGTSEGTYTKSSSSGSMLMLRPSIEYNRTFDNRHTVGALLLYEQRESRTNTMTAQKKGYYFSDPIDLSQGAEIVANSTSGSHGNTAYAGYVGRLNYVYNNKYLAEFSFRADGSYKFRKADRWGFFPAMSLGWTISEEDFIKESVPQINVLKLRGSMGVLGDDYVDPFLHRKFFQLSKDPNYIFGETAGTKPYQSIYTTSSVPSYVTWSKTRSYNIGFETTMWEGLLGFELDLFYKYTYDLLEKTNNVYPSSLGGFFSGMANTGRVDNRGLEVTVRHRNKVSGIDYHFDGTFAWAKNRVLSRVESPGTPWYQSAIGNPIGQLYGYRAIGLYQTQEQLDNRPTGPGGTQNLGDLMYEDINGDGKISLDGDVVKIGNSSNIPQINFSFNMGASYKNFDVAALWQGIAIADIALSYKTNGVPDNTMFTRPFYGGGNATYYMVEGAWTPENAANAKYPRLSTQWNGNNGWPSSWWIVDGSYLRLKNAQIGYTVPQSALKRMGKGISGLRIFLAGTNLLTFSSFEYVDPEMVNVNNGYYPQQKTYSVGLNLTF